ncbi:MAG: hypothetical protein JNL96_24570 [Planctomycetaceae bacterium]|nr:hypothetical protein [Planctomycetaceae bacterium]
MKALLVAAVAGVCLASSVAFAEEKVGETLFKEDFAVLDPGWGAASDRQRVEGNRLILSPMSNSSYRTLYQGDVYSDIDARAEVALAQGPESNPGGLIFWAADGEHYYVAVVTGDGRFGVMRMVGGRWLYPVQFQKSEALKTGLNAVNEVRIVTHGNTATMYGNGKELVAFTGHPTTSENLIGFFADSSAGENTWSFGKLLIRKPAP